MKLKILSLVCAIAIVAAGKAKSRSERFCLTDATSRCPCVGRKVRCQAKCRCLHCNNREKIDRKMAVVRVSQTSRTQKENHARMRLVKRGQDVRVIQMDSLVPVYVHAKNVETNMEYESLVV